MWDRTNESATKGAEELVLRMLASEVRESEPLQEYAALRAIGKLRLYLMKFIGTVGFQALLSRALALSKLEVSCLGPVQVKPDGSLSGFIQGVPTRDTN